MIFLNRALYALSLIHILYGGVTALVVYMDIFQSSAHIKQYGVDHSFTAFSVIYLSLIHIFILHDAAACPQIGVTRLRVAGFAGTETHKLAGRVKFAP